MVADLWQRKGKISGCFKNSTSALLVEHVLSLISSAIERAPHLRNSFTYNTLIFFLFVVHYLLNFCNLVVVVINL